MPGKIPEYWLKISEKSDWEPKPGMIKTLTLKHPHPFVLFIEKYINNSIRKNQYSSPIQERCRMDYAASVVDSPDNS
jgi:hypothetical protein